METRAHGITERLQAIGVLNAALLMPTQPPHAETAKPNKAMVRRKSATVSPAL